MALSDQAALAIDATFKAKVKVLLVAKAVTVATAGEQPNGLVDDDERRLAQAVLKDPDTWATLGAAAAASLMSGAINTWPVAVLSALSTDADIRSAVLQGTKSVWLSLGGAV